MSNQQDTTGKKASNLKSDCCNSAVDHFPESPSSYEYYVCKVCFKLCEPLPVKQ